MLLNIKSLNINIWSKQILKDISFSMKEWDTLSIMWYNGSWKTTLSKCIMNLVNLSSWKIEFDWEDISNLDIHERSKKWIWYIMQEIPEYTWIKVYTYIYNILKEKFDKDKISYLFDLFWLDYETYKERQFDQHLSWWEKKKIEIITTLMMDKKLYILDEVETSLDATSRNILKDLILKKSNEWISFIIISHNKDLIEVAWKWILLCNQRIQEEWDVKSLYSQYVWECKDCNKKDNCSHKNLNS